MPINCVVFIYTYFDCKQIFKFMENTKAVKRFSGNVFFRVLMLIFFQRNCSVLNMKVRWLTSFLPVFSLLFGLVRRIRALKHWRKRRKSMLRK